MIKKQIDTFESVAITERMHQILTQCQILAAKASSDNESVDRTLLDSQFQILIADYDDLSRQLNSPSLPTLVVDFTDAPIQSFRSF